MSDMTTTQRAWPDDRPELLPFLPLVISVWMDGVLSAEELASLCALVDEPRLLDSDARAALDPWLDPDAPPTPFEIQELGSRIRAARLEGDEGAIDSLADLGLALWRAAGDTEGRWTDERSVAALRAIEESLGVLGAEAARRMVGRPAPTEEARPSAPFDTAAARAYLDRDHRRIRDEILALLPRPELAIPAGLPTPEHRERVLEAVRLLADLGYGGLGYPEAYGGGGDPGGAIAAFETLALGDLSVLVKFGVQFGLFGGSVLQLGTERHHAAYLASIGSLELPGCYAMTETSHGSNVRDLETTAAHDPETDELVVHTPSEGAGKDYIGNAALHGRMATVFARLEVAGKDHGVHAILVPIRAPDGTPLPGVRIEDRGLKLGLNGVDNGRLWFDRVRVPRANLLDRFASIDDEGAYHSPISSSGRRFFTMLRTLVAGRVSIAAASVSATKVGLTIAVRYASERRQFGPKGGPESAILTYPIVQRALLPSLATTLGLHFAVRALQASYVAAGPDDEAELEVEAAGLKAYASDHCTATLQACREACGGQGYLAENRLAALRAASDIFTTFEGANAVLYQLVAKGLLSRFRDQMGDLNLWRALQYLGERAETTITELNPVATRRTDRDHLLDPGFHDAALAYREERLLRSAATRIRARLQDGVDSFEAVTEVQDHLVSLARAHVERIVHTRFVEAASTAPADLAGPLETLAALFSLSRIEAERGWFLESGYVEGGKARAIRSLVGDLCSEVARFAPAWTDTFGIPEGLLPELVRGGSA